jgi:DNA-binding response OmpR family regulator
MALDGSRSDGQPSGDPGKDGVRHRDDRGRDARGRGGHGRDGHDGVGSRRALVADEDPMMLWLLQRALANDFEVTVTHDGQRAVELAASSCPDVIVLDLNMPVLDGFGACRQIRAAHPTVPIVIVSGRLDEASVRAAFEAGASDYLTKPFTPSQLRARLQACLLRVR